MKLQLTSLGTLAALLPAIAAAQTSIPVGTDVEGVAALDFTGDGVLDVAVTRKAPAAIELLVNGGNGTFTPTSSIALTASEPRGLVAADLDGNGTTDLAVCLGDQDAVQLWLRALGSASFVDGGVLAVGLDPARVVAADLDADGDVDLVTSDQGSDSVSILLNAGGAGFGVATTIPVGGGVRGLALGDFLGGLDGSPDIAIAQETAGSVAVLANDGAGSFAPPASLAVGALRQPLDVVGGDFDDDGDNDLASAVVDPLMSTIGFQGSVAGFSFFGAMHIDAGGDRPLAIVTADFDLDGRLDVATANFDSDDASIVTSGATGPTPFSLASVFPAGDGPRALVAADLNQVGGPDLVVANALDGTVTFILDPLVATLDNLEPLCFGDGSGAACPCANEVPAGTTSGCANQTGAGAALQGGGNPSISADSLSFSLTTATPDTFAVLASADNRLPAVAPGAGIPAFDGLRCIGGNLIRHGTRATDASGNALSAWGASFGFAGDIAAQGGFAAGQQRFFQAFYRDDPLLSCGTGQNTSSAVHVVFLP